MDRLLEFLQLPVPHWTDLLDILVLAFLIYQLLLLIRGTRAVQWTVGFLIIGLAYWLSGLGEDMQLTTVHRLLGYILFYLPFAVIVTFQNTIRRALGRFGRNPLLRWFGSRAAAPALIEQIVLAASTLSSRRLGGLIVLEREQGLRDHAETGIEIDARASYDLILSIFTPTTPLHDGAILIREDRIAAAACFLPLTSNPLASKQWGSRHRAAIGITEETDALAVVISEETGEISAAVDGRLSRNLSAAELRGFLVRHLEPAHPEKEAAPARPAEALAPVERTDESRL